MSDLKFPTDIKYTESDEWIRLEGDEAVIGVSDYAQNALSDLVFIELPEVGKTLKAKETFGAVESVKAASDLKMPVSGTVIAVNKALEDTPNRINADPYGEAWMLRIKPSNPAEMDVLMDVETYKKHCEARG